MNLDQPPAYLNLRTAPIDVLTPEEDKPEMEFVLPDILPEDIMHVNTIQFLNRRSPRRRPRQTLTLAPPPPPPRRRSRRAPPRRSCPPPSLSRVPR